jgi:hypothetical protein
METILAYNTGKGIIMCRVQDRKPEKRKEKKTMENQVPLTERHTDMHTHGPMAETLDLGSRDLKTCFGTKN